MSAVTSYAQFNAIPFNAPGLFFVTGGGSGVSSFPNAGISPRLWGRVYAADGSYTWQVVGPDANGNASNLALLWLIQNLSLVQGESPFYTDWGIASQQAVVSQIFPDFSVNATQQRFAPYFASLQITRLPSKPQTKDPRLNGPVYRVVVTLTASAQPIVFDVPSVTQITV